jgi:hypothetical protein
VYTYDKNTMKYSPAAGATTIAASSLSGCSCAGAVYEVAYTVNLKPNVPATGEPKEPFFLMESVTARVATYSGPVGNGAPAADGSCGAALVPQKFSIDFVTSGAS